MPELLDDPQLAPRTKILYEQILARFLATVGGTWVEQVTRQQVEAYLEGLGHLSFRTHHLHQTVIHRLFRFAQERQYIDTNPATFIKRRKPDPAKGEHRSDEAIKYLTRAQVQTLMRVSDTNPRLHAILWLLYESGARIAEVLALRLNSIDLDQGQFPVIGKGNKKRLCFFGERASKALRIYLDHHREAPHTALFTERGKRLNNVRPLSYASAYRDLREVIDEYKSLGSIRFHDLRHTFATERAQILPLEVLRALLGHEKIQTTLIYQKITSRVARESAQEALTKLATSW
jgi:integrase/recombinase XerD